MSSKMSEIGLQKVSKPLKMESNRYFKRRFLQLNINGMLQNLL